MNKKTGSKTGPKAGKQEAPSFEKALDRLEAIVSQLERAEAPLDQALSLYEEGVGLARICSAQLKAAERKVELLEEKGSALRSRPFEDESNTSSGSKFEEDEDEDDDQEEDDEDEEDDEEDDSASDDEEDDDTEQETLF